MSTAPTSSAKILQFHRAAARPRAVASIEANGLAADIFHNPEIYPLTWHYIVSRLGDSEVLYWGQERSLERARNAANLTINSIAQKAVRSR